MNEVAKMNDQRAVVAHQQSDPMVNLIERIVSDPNASIDKLERMLEMRERMQAAQAKAAYDNAIAAAKSEIKPIIKTGRVSYGEGTKKTEFQHETLDGIAAAIDPILSSHGLSYRFRSDQKEGGVCVTCIVAHRDGYSEETTLRGSPDTSGSKNAYQAIGSAVTYLQRYTLKLALGLSAAKDDDGNGATPKAEAITEKQFQDLRSLIEQAKADEDAFLGFLKIDALHDLPQSRFYEAETLLRRKLTKGPANA